MITILLLLPVAAALMTVAAALMTVTAGRLLARWRRWRGRRQVIAALEQVTARHINDLVPRQRGPVLTGVIPGPRSGEDR